MKNHLQRLLSLLCVLALALGCASAYAEDPAQQYDARVLIAEWIDGNNYDGLRAAFQATYAGRTVTMSEENGWTGEVSVPAGTTGSWEVAAPQGYTATVTPSSDSLSTVRLRHEVPDPVSVTATVSWADDEDAGKIRPDKVQLLLLANGVAYGEPRFAMSPNWKVEWTDLPARKPQGTETIEYTVRAVQTPAGYTEADSGTSVTFALLRANLSLSVSVAGYPEGADLSGLTLRVDGPDPSMPLDLTWSQVSGGSYDFGNVLPGAYLVMGTAPAIDGYTMDTANSDVSDAVYVKEGESASLSYRYVYKLPEPIEDADPDYDPTASFGNLTFEILGPDPSLPMTVTYAQFTNGRFELPQNLVPGRYTVIERNAESLVNYYILDIDSITGAVIEVSAAAGTSVARLYNKYTPAPTPEPDAEFIDVPVSKTWADNNNADGNRPDSVTVRLYADGVEVASHVLTAAEK